MKAFEEASQTWKEGEISQRVFNGDVQKYNLHVVDRVRSDGFDPLPDANALQKFNGAVVQGGHAIAELTFDGKAFELGSTLQEEDGLVGENFLVS